MYKFFNPNPENQFVGDCVIRAISRLENLPWEETYMRIAAKGLELYDMPSSNRVWGEYLYSIGYRREIVPNTCPHCYRVKDFCREHPFGKFLLATGSHVIAVVNGDYYDTSDTGNEIPIYYWRKEN
jgi:hypothetical protein